MNELISEFFYEGIRRIIPGLIVIALYWHTEAERSFGAHKYFASGIVFVACVLWVAWLIGFVIGQVTVILGTSFLPRIDRWLDRFVKFPGVGPNRTTKSPHVESEGKSKKVVLEENREKRRYRLLCVAEKEMSRSLIAIFVFASFKPPESFSNFYWEHPYYGIVGVIAFALCWVWARMNEHNTS